MNDPSSNQNTGNPGAPPVIADVQAGTPPRLTDGPSASLFRPRPVELTLNDILSRIASRQWRLHLWMRLAACWAGAALLGICLVVVQRQNGWTSALALPIVAALAVIAALVVLVRYRRRDADLHDLARQIEAKHPELDGLLLTAVQQEANDDRPLNYLQQRLVREATIHSHKRDWAAIVPKSRLALAQLAHVAALVVFVVVLAKLRVTGGHSLFAKIPNAEISVTPGDTSLERGSSLVVLARFGRSLPANVDLVVAATAGAGNRIPLVKSLADPVFGGSIPEVASNLTYHVEYGGRHTRDFKVTVFDYPRLERADADIVFPGYTGQKPQHIDNTRRITAAEGSQVNFALQLNKPVTSARLVAKDRGLSTIPLIVETNRPVATLKQFPLDASQTYDLQLVDAEGRTNKMPAQFVFAVLTNRTPELRLASPRGDTRPSPLEEMSFDGTVWDDFGVKAYGLGYQVVGQEPKFIQLGGAVAAKEKQSFHYLLPLEKLGVQPDQLISWFAWADDIGPDGQVRRTPGDLFFGEVRPFEEVFREGQGMEGQQQQQNQMGGGQQGGQAGRLAELQKQIINATWRLQRENNGRKEPAPGTKDKPATDVTPNPKQSSDTPASREKYFVAVRQFAGQPAPGRGSAPITRPSNPARSATARNASSSSGYVDDATVVRDSQEQALEQARQSMEQQQNPRTIALWSAAIKRMEDALKKLDEARSSPASLAQALTEEQSAYQALLKLQEHEYNVVRSRNQGQGGGGQSQQMQRELDQLDLTQPENRYETQRQAQAPQTAQRREQLQIMNRLQELARRQQDLNERLKELQTELQEARTQQEREDVQRRLKRLQDEEQQMLADVDELRQRMDRPENQSSMSDARQQLDQTRNDVQRAAEAASQNDPSQALASGARAQRQLQDLRDQLRKESSSQFADDLREMRAQARELARQQDDILKKMEQEAQSERKSLADSAEHKEMLDQLARQRERMTNIVDRATQISQQAETAEPLLSQQLYDTVRTFSQDSAKNLNEVQDQLLNRGIMTRGIYDQLKDPSKQDGTKLLDLTSELLRLGFLPQANDTGQRSRASIENLRRGVERAAGSVLGDDTEALRLAQQQLEQLTDQLRNEIARAQGNGTNQQPSRASQAGANPNAANRQSGDNQRAQSQNSSERAGQTAQNGDPGRQNSDRAGSRQGGNQPDNEAQSSEQQTASAQQGDQQDRQANGGGQQSGQRASGQNPQRGQNRGNNLQTQVAQNDQQGSLRGGNPQRGQRLGGNRGGSVSTANGGDWGGEVGNVVDRLLNRDATQITAPLTGGDFVPWSDGLREVEEMIEIPDLRNGVAVARDRASALRQEFRRSGKTPDWAVVQLQVLKPLVEVRNEIADELARRGSKEALVPLDRDPVPTRYSELVRRYYEELGKDQPAPQAK